MVGDALIDGERWAKMGVTTTSKGMIGSVFYVYLETNRSDGTWILRPYRSEYNPDPQPVFWGRPSLQVDESVPLGTPPTGHLKLISTRASVDVPAGQFKAYDYFISDDGFQTRNDGTYRNERHSYEVPNVGQVEQTTYEQFCGGKLYLKFHTVLMDVHLVGAN